MMKKQIHRFLRAARAESTALLVYCNLRVRVNQTKVIPKTGSAPRFCIFFDISRGRLDRIDDLFLLCD